MTVLTPSVRSSTEVFQGGKGSKIDETGRVALGSTEIFGAEAVTLSPPPAPSTLSLLPIVAIAGCNGTARIAIAGVVIAA